MPVDRISITTPNLRVILGHTYNMFHIMVIFPSRITTIIILTIYVIIVARNLYSPQVSRARHGCSHVVGRLFPTRNRWRSTSRF